MKPNFMPSTYVFFLMGLLGLETLKAQNYYPTHAGNRWGYEVEQWWAGATDTTKRSAVVTVIGDTLMPNGFTYSHLDTLDCCASLLTMPEVASSMAKVTVWKRGPISQWPLETFGHLLEVRKKL
jgi:hypothetical protein